MKVSLNLEKKNKYIISISLVANWLFMGTCIESNVVVKSWLLKDWPWEEPSLLGQSYS
jgi:hypothetical protein